MVYRHFSKSIKGMQPRSLFIADALIIGSVPPILRPVYGPPAPVVVSCLCGKQRETISPKLLVQDSYLGPWCEYCGG